MSKTIAYFISGHGFGHGVRSCALLNRVPPCHTVLLFSSLPPSFFEGELNREYRLVPCEIDCGCVQPDSMQVDIQGTLDRYRAIEKKRNELIPFYADILTTNGVDVVLADIPPLAFPIAREAGVPSYGITNFTWADIYAPYISHQSDFGPVVSGIRNDYAMADGLLLLEPGAMGSGFSRKIPVGMVSRQGRVRREYLASRYGLDPNKKWCLVYLGNFGIGDISWAGLEAFLDWEFFGLYDLPGVPKNYFQVHVDAHQNYADLTASSDVVLGKLGYGLVSECLSHGVGVAFLERYDFSEYFALRKALIEREQGVELNLKQIRDLEFLPELEKIHQKTYSPLPAEGIETILEVLEL